VYASGAPPTVVSRFLAWARDLLRDNPAVRHAAQTRYQRIFIDEFQDTDPLQAEIAFYLAADELEWQPLPADWRDARCVPGKLFVVGDPKQSIYRFRGADSRSMTTCCSECGMRASLSRTISGRSGRVLDWVNHHFAAHMQADVGSARIRAARGAVAGARWRGVRRAPHRGPPRRGRPRRKSPIFAALSWRG
jgi:ATP-dependent exoDNAse (exonuclease V) beta subunit